MSDLADPTGEIETPKITDRYEKPTEVRIDHPSIRSFVIQMAKDGRTKEDAVKLTGCTYEVVDRYYQEFKKSQRKEED